MNTISPLNKARLPQLMAFLDWESQRRNLSCDEVLKSWIHAEFLTSVQGQFTGLLGSDCPELPDLSAQSAVQYKEALEKALREKPLELMSRENSPVVGMVRQVLLALVEEKNEILNEFIGHFLDSIAKDVGLLNGTEAMWEIAFVYLEATAFALFSKEAPQALSSAYGGLTSLDGTESENKVKLYAHLWRHFLQLAKSDADLYEPYAVLSQYLMMEAAYSDSSLTVKADILEQMTDLIPAFNLID